MTCSRLNSPGAIRNNECKSLVLVVGFASSENVISGRHCSLQFGVGGQVKRDFEDFVRKDLLGFVTQSQ